jgi:hypothetical protein
MTPERLTSRTFGRLTALGPCHGGRLAKWVCRCWCGNFHDAFPYHLISGQVTACDVCREDNHMITELLDMLRNYVPHAGQVSQIYTVLGLLPKDFVPILLKGLDGEVVKKMAVWSTTFIEDLNQIQWPHVGDKDAGLADYEADYLSLTKGTRYEGLRLNFEDVEQAANAIAKAIKAQNFEDAVLAAIKLSSGMAGA